MKIWFTADMLFGDADVIRDRGRPFADVATMDAAIVNRWNDMVQPADTVWILGGAVGGIIWASLPLLKALHGRKHLIAGSADRCFHKQDERVLSPKELAEWTAAYRREGGLLSVNTGAQLVNRRPARSKPVPVQIPLMGGTGHGYPNVVLSAFHTPHDGVSDDPFAAYRPQWRDRRDGQAAHFLHGHAPWVTRDLPGRSGVWPGRELNVGMDAWDFEPVPADVVASLLVDA